MADSKLSFSHGSVTALLLLAGCASPPDLGPPPLPRSASSYAANMLDGGTSNAWPATDWWRAYRDPELTRLIELGLAGAPDLAAAAARLRQAQGYARQAGAALLPRVDADASAGGAKQSYNNGIPAAFVPRGWQDTATIDGAVSLDLDLWGRNRAALRAARRETDAAALELAQARLVLSTSIADAYADLARLYAERAVQVRARDIRIATQALVARRVKDGLDTRAEQRQADAAVPQSAGDIAATDETIALTRNRIAALLGLGPDAGRAIVPPAVAPAAQMLPADVTTDLIGRRPDVAAARARADAASQRVKSARAAFYPDISIKALVGVQSLGLDTLLKSGSGYGNAGAAMSLPIFHGGELAGSYTNARGRFDEAVATYDGTVATAFREVADAVASRDALAVRLDQGRRALVASRDGYGIAERRYAGGLSTYLDVLSAQSRMLQDERTLADLQARAFTLDVALIRALGGGFHAGDTAASLPNGKDIFHG